MKIYYVANARMPTEKAHGIQIAKMCEALIEAGADLELIVPRRGAATRTVKDFYGLRVDIPTVRIWTPDWYGSKIGFWISSCAFMQGYARHLRKKKRMGDAGVVWAIDIDQFSFAFIPFLGMPYIAEIHDAKQWSIVFDKLFLRAEKIIVINDIIKKETMTRFRIPEEKIDVLPNVVDKQMFASEESKPRARAALGLPGEKPIVMYAGRVYDWKGLDIFVRIAERLPDALFYLVGGTAEELRAVGAMDEQPANLICVGSKPFTEIPRWLWTADVLLALGTRRNPYSCLHTSPMKLFEYAMARRPIVSSGTPAAREVFSDDEVFFYNPDMADSAVREIKYVFANPKEAERRAHKAHEKIKNAFTYEIRAKAILAAVKNRL